MRTLDGWLQDTICLLDFQVDANCIPQRGVQKGGWHGCFFFLPKHTVL